MATNIPVSDQQELVAPGSTTAQRERTSGTEDEVSLLDLLLVLAERKRLIVWTTVVFAIVSAIVAFILPKSYTATVTLLPPQQNSSLSSQLAAQLGGMGGVAATLSGSGGLLRNPNDMFVAMFRSRPVEYGMINRFGLMQEYHTKYLSDARKKFEHYASVDGSGKDGLIHISVDDRDPQRAAELANGYVDQYRDLSQHLAITEAQQRRQFFENQLQQANQNLADSEEALKVTEQKTGLIQLDSQTRALIESAAALRAQVAAKEVQIQGMQTYATGENAQLVEAEQELTSMRSQLAKLGGGGDNPDNIIVPKGQMTAAGIEYVRRLRDVKYYETIFDILARQFELAKLDEAKEGAVIQVVEPAIPPDKKSSPRRGLIILVSTAFGFIVGVIVAFLQAVLRRLNGNTESASKLHSLRNALAFRRQGEHKSQA